MEKVNIDRVIEKMPFDCWIILAAMLGRPYPFTYEAKRAMIKDMLFPTHYGGIGEERDN